MKFKASTYERLRINTSQRLTNELPLVVPNLRNAQPRHLEHLHIGQFATLLRVKLQLLKRDELVEFLAEGHMHETPLGLVL